MLSEGRKIVKYSGLEQSVSTEHLEQLVQLLSQQAETVKANLSGSLWIPESLGCPLFFHTALISSLGIGLFLVMKRSAPNPPF